MKSEKLKQLLNQDAPIQAEAAGYHFKFLPLDGSERHQLLLLLTPEGAVDKDEKPDAEKIFRSWTPAKLNELKAIIKPKIVQFGGYNDMTIAHKALEFIDVWDLLAIAGTMRDMCSLSEAEAKNSASSPDTPSAASSPTAPTAETASVSGGANSA